MGFEFTRIFSACIMQDMRTRFGRSHFSYLIAIGWPMLHMIIIMCGYLLVNHIAPLGEEPGVFIATGCLPYILCLYPARNTATAISLNRPLLQYPIIRPIHIIFTRVCLECVTAFTVMLVMVIGFNLNGIIFSPLDPTQAALAILAAVYFGISIGVLGVGLCALQPTFGILTIVMSLAALYFTSGVFLPITFYPTSVKDVMWYNPLYHIVGLLRGSFYQSYENEQLSYFYILFVSNCNLCIGLLCERFLRGKIISPG